MVKLITLTLLGLLLVLELFQGVFGFKSYACVSCPSDTDDFEQRIGSCTWIGDSNDNELDDPINSHRYDVLCSRDIRNITECGLANPVRKVKKCVPGAIPGCVCVVETCDDIELGKGAGREGSAEGNSTSSSSILTFDIIFAGYTFIIQFIHFSFQVATHI